MLHKNNLLQTLPLIVGSIICFSLIFEWKYEVYTIGKWVISAIATTYTIINYKKYKSECVHEKLGYLGPSLGLAIMHGHIVLFFIPILEHNFGRIGWQIMDIIGGIAFLVLASLEIKNKN